MNGNDRGNEDGGEGRGNNIRRQPTQFDRPCSGRSTGKPARERASAFIPVSLSRSLSRAAGTRVRLTGPSNTKQIETNVLRCIE